MPTEHPLAIAAGAVLSLFGEVGDRLWIAVIFASFLWLIWGVYRLGQIAFTPLIGGIAAVLVLTRFDFGFLMARGYIDIPYMAIVMWAAVLEARRPRRGVPVLLLLAAAGMLRPEAWVLAGLYWLWLAWRATWRERALYAVLAALGPLVWTATDFVVTGDPLFSLLYTSGSAEDLGRQRSLAELPTAIPGFLNLIVKPPIMAAAVGGLALALALAPRRTVMPLVLLGSGVGTFVLIGIAGASVIERYLAIAAVAVLRVRRRLPRRLHAAAPGPVRTGWMAGSAALVLFGVVFTATQVRLDYFDSELTFRGAAHDDLVRVLKSDAVQDGLRCGPLTVPNHKLVPDSRWILDAPRDRVIARADPDAPRPRRGVALVVTSRFAVFKHAWSNDTDSPLIQSPPAGFERSDRRLLRRLCALLARVGALRGRRLVLRLWGVDHGLPYVFNADENAHFVPRAIGMFGHSLNPDYFINPPAFTYLLHVAFWLRWGEPRGARRRVRGRPRDGVHDRARARPPCSAPPRSASSRGPARGCSTGASGCSRRRCSRSPSCPCTTRTWRSTTCRRWRRCACALVGVAGVYRRGRHARLRAGRGGARRRRARPSTRPASCCVCLVGGGAVRARQPLARPGARRRRWRWSRSSSPTRTRCSTGSRSATGCTQQSAGVQRRRRQARPRRRQRPPLLPRAR